MSMSAPATLASSQRGFRFSIATLLLCVLLIASAGTLYMHREPWYLVKIWNETPRPDPGDRFALFLPPTFLSSDFAHAITPQTRNVLRILNLKDNSAIELQSPEGLFKGSEIWIDLDEQSIEFSRDGTRILTRTSASLLSYTDDSERSKVMRRRFDGCDYLRQVRLWDAKTGRMLKILDHEAFVESMEFSPSGELILTFGHDCCVKCWRASDGELQFTLAANSEAKVQPQRFRIGGATPRFCQNGESIAIPEDDYNSFSVWDVKSQTRKRTHEGHTGAEFPRGSPDIYANRYNETIVWDAAGKLRVKLPGRITSVSPDERFFATESKERHFRIWDSATLQLKDEFEGSFKGFGENGKPIVYDHKRTPWLRTKYFNNFFYKKDPDFPDAGRVDWSKIAISDDGRHSAAFLDSGPAVWSSDNIETRFELGALSQNTSLGYRLCSVHFLSNDTLVGFGSHNTVARWEYRRPIGLLGLAWLPELWSTLFLFGALFWSVARDRKGG